jgi:GrpB-like predicted nucleotidyltransferase (UPF0157 family)
MTDDESLLAAIDEDVVLRPYDPSWPGIFATERLRLMAIFPEELIDVQHVGSTAVPGLQAKPIVDILAGVKSMAVAESLVARLCESGYTTSAEFNATLSDSKWFMQWANGHRTHHLLLVPHGDAQWRQRLRFRDALRSDAQLAVRYSLLKTELAAKYTGDREAYTNAKAEFVLSVSGNA